MAKYKPGDRLRVRSDSPPGHVRTPAYIRGKTGRVEMVHGEFGNPESLAYDGDGLPKQPLYMLTFPQTEVWHQYHGSPPDRVYADIYEHWLEPADEEGDL